MRICEFVLKIVKKRSGYQIFVDFGRLDSNTQLKSCNSMSRYIDIPFNIEFVHKRKNILVDKYVIIPSGSGGIGGLALVVHSVAVRHDGVCL